MGRAHHLFNMRTQCVCTCTCAHILHTATMRVRACGNKLRRTSRGASLQHTDTTDTTTDQAHSLVAFCHAHTNAHQSAKVTLGGVCAEDSLSPAGRVGGEGPINSSAPKVWVGAQKQPTQRRTIESSLRRDAHESTQRKRGPQQTLRKSMAVCEKFCCASRVSQTQDSVPIMRILWRWDRPVVPTPMPTPLGKCTTDCGLSSQLSTLCHGKQTDRRRWLVVCTADRRTHLGRMRLRA